MDRSVLRTNLHSVFSGVSTIGSANLIPLFSPFLSGINFHSPPRLNKCSFNSGETWNGEIHPLVRSALFLSALKYLVKQISCDFGDNFMITYKSVQTFLSEGGRAGTSGSKVRLVFVPGSPF